MGNIVSNAVVPGQLANTAGGGAFSAPMGGVPPATPVAGQAASVTPPTSGLPPAEPTTPAAPPGPVSTTTIEGVGLPTPAGFNVDPFGPMPTPPDVPLGAPPGALTPKEPPSITPEPPPVQTPQPFTQPTEEATTEVTHASAAELLSRMPDIAQMMKDLEKSGCLLPELQIKSSTHMDTSPLAALQPQRLKDNTFFSSPTDEPTLKVLPEVQLATAIGAQPAPKTELPLFVFVAVITLLQGFQGIVQLLHFILVRYPSYEQMIVVNAITTSDVDTAVVKAIILGIFAVLGFLMGFVLLLKKPKNNTPTMYFMLTLIVINFVIQNFLATKIFASGSPLVLPEIIGDILSRPKY